jgi:hypothetical protein
VESFSGDLESVSAIVLDLRINGGGDTGTGFQILRDLAAAPFLGSRQGERRYDPTARARGTLMEFIDIAADSNEPQPGATNPNRWLCWPARLRFPRRKIF